MLTASPARADLIVVNAADYPLGTDLSTAFDGLAISRLTQAGDPTFNPFVSPVNTVVSYPISAQSLGATRGLSEYETCRTAAGASISCLAGFSVLEFTFAAPTDFFQIDGHFFTDPNYLLAYDVLGNLIAGFDAATRTWGTGIEGTFELDVDARPRGARHRASGLWRLQRHHRDADGVSLQRTRARHPGARGTWRRRGRHAAPAQKVSIGRRSRRLAFVTRVRRPIRSAVARLSPFLQA